MTTVKMCFSLRCTSSIISRIMKAVKATLTSLSVKSSRASSIQAQVLLRRILHSTTINFILEVSSMYLLNQVMPQHQIGGRSSRSKCLIDSYNSSLTLSSAQQALMLTSMTKSMEVVIQASMNSITNGSQKISRK